MSTLIKDIAATVSVALNTALISNIYVSVNAQKKKLLMIIRNPVMHKNPMMVPIIPKKATIAKFQKNKDFLRLQPAEKMIGGKMIVKNISLLNSIYCWSAYFEMAAVIIPIKMAIEDS